MAFDVSGDAYDRFMGRFSVQLAPLFADFAGIGRGEQVLDVGAGPGALTAELVRRVGAERVAAIDPSPRFVDVLRERLPGVDVRQAGAEELPFEDGAFDAALSQLAVTFMRDAVAGVRELARVVRTGSVVAACMWAEGPGMELLDSVHGAAAAVAPEQPSTRQPPRYRNEPALRELFEQAGVAEIETAPLDVQAGYDGFEELWESVLGGVGPLGELIAALDERKLEQLRAELIRRVGEPAGAFILAGRAWAVRGRAA